jgi:pimeloyl-ACP methyl ester carboxylesterase
MILVRCLFTFVILQLTSITVLVQAQQISHFQPKFELSNTPTHKIPKNQNYTFGYLEVLENRSNPHSKTIKIPVYHFKSRSSSPKIDPIIYTVGGPGSTTMPSAQYMNYYKYLDDRDLILVEQRGNLYAEPHLDCPEWAEAVYKANLSDFDKNQKEALLKKAALACRERLIAKGIDLNGYNTNEIAADISDLVNVLGIEQYNLLTISYSTKIAQVLLRDYPKGIRSVVMDSPLPLEANYDEESIHNLMDSLNKLFADCEASLICSTTYPNLKERFFNYLVDKSRKPLTVHVKDPNSEILNEFELKGKDLISMFTSVSTNEVSDIPFEINKLLNNDLSSVKRQLTSRFEKPSTGAGIGMRLSVWCAEEYPFNNQDIISKEKYAYPEVEGLSPAVFDATICEAWNVSKVSDIEKLAVKSDIPVLLISGEYDNETPVKWAANMKKNLSNSHHLIFKGWKHTPTTNWGNLCAMESANAFFNEPKIKPNLACFEDVKVPMFRTE